ncbi:MAG: alpha/beta fold hydrolase [Gemmatimonadota bacterium]|nr:alpha/beta fold hydrolase [Gemmatimonadota bacterium]MDQ8172035.1 alpha/beta fold hydrolase [Gemmatimonadota bacterium]
MTLTPRKFLRSLALAAAVFPMGPTESAGAQDRPPSREPFAGLDAYVNEAIKSWKVPGVALAIVRNDSVIYARGYGVRDVTNGTPVDENTIFAIGSSSKAFTAAAVAMLVDEKKVELDAPVTKYLPWFQLADPYASREITVRDLLSHRSGLARGELAWYGSGFDRDEIVRRVRFLQPTWSFRSQFGYQNIMYIAAGQIVAKVSGMTWDDFVTQRILTPLAMTSSNTTIRGLEKRSNVASPHADVDGTIVPVPWRNIDNAGPAGSINSNVMDMAQWVSLQMGTGTVGGRQMLTRRMLDEMHAPHTIIRLDSASRANNPDTHYSSYGMGWFLEDYRGREVIHHGGNVDGFTALVGMMPEERLGVVLLTNMNGTGMPMTLLRRIFDMQLKAPTRDWSGQAVTRMEQQRSRALEAQRRAGGPPKPSGGKPSLALSEYVGTYADSLHGDMVVTELNGALQLRFGPNWRGTMEYWNAENFRVRFATPVLPAFFVTFAVTPTGKVTQLVAELVGSPVVFGRRPPKPPVDYSAPAGAPYTAVNVTVSTPMGHTLAGTLTLPAGASKEKPVAAIVTITGSGGQERDEPLGPNSTYVPFRQIADSLARRGIATLRMDDRGIGQSKGNHATATSADFAEDIRAGLAYLRTRPEVDAARLGLVGHSEGGLIAPLVAAKEPALKGIVLLAGPGKGGADILKFQLTNLANGDTSLTTAARAERIRQIPIYIDSLKASNPWMNFFFAHDPLATARQVKVPVLILNGATDQQVTPDQVPVLARAFKAAGNKDVTTRIFPKMNHLFVYDPVGFPGNYGKLVNPRVELDVVGSVADWLTVRLR